MTLCTEYPSLLFLKKKKNLLCSRVFTLVEKFEQIPTTTMVSSIAVRLRFSLGILSGLLGTDEKTHNKKYIPGLRSVLTQKYGWSFFIAYLFPLVAVLSATLAVVTTPYDPSRVDYSVFWSLLGVLYAFVMIPLLDSVLGLDITNADKKNEFFRMLVRLYVPVDFLMLWAVIHIVSSYQDTLSTAAIVGSVISLGTSNSMAFTVAHELLHSSAAVERTLSSMLLVPNFYMHWTRAHLQHHAWVGTDRDPTTARKNETVYAFWWRSIYGNLVNAYAAESKKRSKRTLVGWIAFPLLLLSLNYIIYGMLGVAVQLGQAIVSILLLETVNYIEHYGLSRNKVDGVYERVQPRHSWNATTMFTNAASFNLQRHSDHHAHERKSYEKLEHMPDAPQLPYGYPAMMLLSLLPPLYFKTMNPRLASTRE